MTEKDILPFDFQKASVKRIIKVIGVGGGGGNAVKNMFREGIHDVAFALCNTDIQALAESEIPTKVQLGNTGLGAGNEPEVACKAAEESIEQIRALFTDDTKMVFVTAGMGGGTGTGASPIIAREAKAAGMLTVGVVTIPFRFEKMPKILQALKGVDAIAANVDALLVINNERLLDIYPNMPIAQGFAKVNEILTVAVKSIAELITVHGTINLDFCDVQKVLKDGGVAVMSYGLGKGEHRLTAAINEALHSPLLNDNDVYHSKKILFNIYQSMEHPIYVQELEELDQFMDEFREKDIEVIWGIANDESLDEDVKITILATGFGLSTLPGMEVGEKLSTDQLNVNGDVEDSAPVSVEEESQIELELMHPIASDEDRVASIYGENIHTFIFEDDDLFDDILIAAVAQSPTFSRTGQDLKNLYAQSQRVAINDEF